MKDIVVTPQRRYLSSPLVADLLSKSGKEPSIISCLHLHMQLGWYAQRDMGLVARRS